MIRIGDRVSFKKRSSGEFLTGVVKDVTNSKAEIPKVKVCVDFKQYHIWVNQSDINVMETK